MSEMFILQRGDGVPAQGSVLWLLNEQLARAHQTISLDEQTFVRRGLRSVGSYLSETFAGRYAAIAGVAGRLNVALAEFGSHRVDQQADSLARALSHLGDAGYVNLHSEPSLLHPAGRAYRLLTPSGYVSARPAEQFDAVLYLAESPGGGNAFAAGLVGPYSYDWGRVVDLAATLENSAPRAEPAQWLVRSSLITEEIPLRLELQLQSGFVPDPSTATFLDNTDTMQLTAQLPSASSGAERYVAVSGSVRFRGTAFPEQLALVVYDATFAAVVDGELIVDGPKLRIGRAEISATLR